MNIGIVGTDERAQAIGRLFKAAGHTVTFGDPCSEEAADRAATALGTEADRPYDQGITSEVLVFTTPEHLDQTITALGSGSDAVFVDAIEGEHGGDDDTSGAECLALKLNTHRVVRALINIPQSGTNIQICGDDPHAKTVVQELFESCGCTTTDRGPLSQAGELEAPTGAPTPIH